MAANSYQLPDDSLNTGVNIRTFSRTVSAVDQEENYFHVAYGEAVTLANVAASATSVTLQAANQQRIGWRVFNDSDVGTLFVKLGTTASVTSFTHVVPPRGSWVLDVPYAGIITGLWDSTGGTAIGGGTSSARVTEVTP